MKIDENLPDKAKEFALDAHGDQKYGKSDKPYSYHLTQVADLVARRYEDPELTAAAWLHDTVEDADVTVDQIRDKFGVRVANLVDEMTHDPEVPYHTYIARMSRDTAKLKQIDLMCNITEAQNQPRLSGYEKQRLAKYLMAQSYLIVRNPIGGEGLCYRCEHRARYMEHGHGPRCECQDFLGNKYGCYMYRPVRPVVTGVDEGDARAQFAGSLLSARAHFIRVLDDKKDIVMKACETHDGHRYLTWDDVHEKEDNGD